MRFDLTHAPTRLVSWWKVGSSRRRAVAFVIFLVIALAATSLGSIYYGMVLYKTRRADSLDQFLENLSATKLAVVPHAIRGQLFAKPQRLAIAMKQSDFLKLAQKRQEALQQGILMDTGDEFVPAFIQLGERQVEVRMRLKGDWTDHLLGDKWSYRVKVKGDATVMGMKTFSLHHPRARNFAYEWLFHKTLEREGIMGLRYDFVEVSLNGNNLGIYALEEHFEKRLIESQRRREGPIIKLNENLMWADRSRQPRRLEGSPTGIQSEHTAFVDAFGRESLMKDPAMAKRFQLAHDLLEGFRYGQVPAHKVFDVDRLATMYALCDLLGSPHAAVWHNLRFYFNPVTSLLEPIGFDANPGHKTPAPMGALRDWEDHANKFKDLALSDPLFFAAYTRALERVSQENYLQALKKETQDELGHKLDVLYKEFPWFHFSWSPFEYNREVIQTALHPAKGLHAYARGRTGDHLLLEMGNIQGMPLEVLRVTYRDSLVLEPAKAIVLPPKVPTKPTQYVVVDLPLPTHVPAALPLSRHLTVTYRILGASEAHTDDVFSWTRLDSELLSHDLVRQDPNLELLTGAVVDDAKQRIRFRPGTWTIEADIVIPAGYVVEAGPGTELVLAKGVTLLSYSPFHFLGSEEEPIVVRSEENRGRGLVVIGASQGSEFEYAHLVQMANPSRPGWTLTGAYTFYESPVHFRRCRFGDNSSEDALNIIRSDFVIDSCVFSNTSSDAFDADFCSGRVENSLFSMCENDGIDVSGSVIEVLGCRLQDVGDKGLSAGEESQMEARNVRFDRVGIALASKDESSLTVADSRIADCEVGITIFQKKPEFGPATMKVTGLQMDAVSVPYLLEQNSGLVMDGRKLAANRTTVKDELYGKRYGRASKR